MGRMPQMRKHILRKRTTITTAKVEKVKNAVFEECKTGQKEKRQAIVIPWQIPVHAFIVFPTENANYYSPILHRLISYIQDTLSFTDAWGVSHWNCLTSSPNVFAKRRSWVGLRCKWQGTTTQADRFGHLNEIIFLERNYSESKRRYSHAAWSVTELITHNYHRD